MKQRFIVTIDAEAEITSKEVADALCFCRDIYSLSFNHDEIILATARKVKIDKKK